MAVNWRKKVIANAAANPVIPTTWDMLKDFMTTEIRLIKADPAIKKNLNVANAVQEKANKTETDLQFVAQIQIATNNEIEELRAELAAMKDQANLAGAITANKENTKPEDPIEKMMRLFNTKFDKME